MFCAGLAEYFRASSTEEREHAEKLMAQQVPNQAPDCHLVFPDCWLQAAWI